MMRVFRSLRISGFNHRFTLTGLNLERFLNLLLKNGIPLLRAERRSSRAMVCECHSADLRKLRQLAEERGLGISDVQPLGLSSWLAFLRSRPGIPLGIALCLIIALTLSQFVWKVEIHGAASYHAEIVSYLEENGFAPGLRRSRVDAKALERELTYRYPEIAWFHVYVSGVKMVVDVTPGVAPPDLPKDTPGDVRASRGGIVTSIQVFAGTAKVRPGDVVQKGQILIEGYERAADDQFTAVSAQGVVMARCWESHTVAVACYEITSEETGRESHASRIRTPLGFFPQKTEEPDYLAFNTYMEEFPVGGVFFPVFFQRMIQREVSMEYRLRDAAKVRAEAAEAALKHLKTKHFGDEIIDKWVDYCMIEGGSLAATATVEWLMDIGGTSVP